MNSIVVFLVKVLVNFLDPFAMAGYIAAGAYIRAYWKALAVGLTWYVLALVFFAMPVAKSYGSSVPISTIAASVTAAIIATSVAYFVRRSFRHRKESQEPTKASDAIDSSC